MSLETHELHEHMTKAIEHVEEAFERESPQWLFQLSLSMALVAVLAAVASLKAEKLANQSLLAKNDAILLQAKTSDQWAYYEAKSIKRVIYESQHQEREAKKYEADQDKIKSVAQTLEKEVAEYNKISADFFEGHHHFALAVTLFQVTIALSAIASLARQKLLWYFGLLISCGGIVILFKFWQ